MHDSSWTYFAYGSNLLQARLQARTPSARVLGIGRLLGHDLRFHKIGDDHSGKCDAFATDCLHDVVWGRLYDLALAEKPILDAIEGVGCGYELKQVSIESNQGSIEAWTYVVDPNYIDPNIQPFDWYHAFVQEGARECRFPAPYLARIENVRWKEDSDQLRRSKNRALLPSKQGSS